MLSESDRRILAHLSEPRSISNLTRVLCSDQHAPFDDGQGFEAVRDTVGVLVDRLVDEERIVALGTRLDAKAALSAVAAADTAIDLPKVKADALRRRLESGRDGRLDTGPLFILSTTGLAALQA